jgi:hypothetical protein
MYNIFESAMSTQFDLSAMIDKINRHNIMGALTDDERDKLVNLAREKANPAGGLDVMKKLQEMEERIRALEEAKITGGESSNAEKIDPYEDGKWYKNGDKISWNSKVYVCVNVPEGHYCTWNPDVYPAYWELVE